MINAGFSLLKSFGKSAAKRKRDGDEDASPGDPDTDSASKRARNADAPPGGNAAGGASFITSSVRKTRVKPPAAAASDSVPRDLRDRFQSVDENGAGAAGTRSRARKASSGSVMGGIFSPMFSFFGGGGGKKASAKPSAAAARKKESENGAEARARLSARAPPGPGRRDASAAAASARTRGAPERSEPRAGSLRPASDSDDDDDLPIAHLVRGRGPASSLESDEAEETESDGALLATSALDAEGKEAATSAPSASLRSPSSAAPGPVIMDGFGAPETALKDEYEYEDEMDEDDYDEDFDPWVFIGGLPPLSRCAPKHRPAMLPKTSPVHKNKNTLVLDLDETLVHSNLEQTLSFPADFSFPVNFNNQEHIVNVRRRPYLTEFMEFAARHFEVVVFTASQRVYAERLLNEIDPDGVLIQHRLYRDACLLVEGNYMKDLSVLGRDMSRTIIVDNSPQAFGFQVENGVPIESWFDDEHDRQLLKLMPLLARLAAARDVRPVLRHKFQLEERIRRAGDRVANQRG